jgi:hypothetical protein
MGGTVEKDLSAFDAGPGRVWVCGVCRSHGDNRATLGATPGGARGGACCFLHAILCEKQDLDIDNGGRVASCREASRR